MEATVVKSRVHVAFEASSVTKLLQIISSGSRGRSNGTTTGFQEKPNV